MEDLCTYDLVQANISNACEYVKANCEYSYINFFAVHYCAFDGALYFSVPVMLIFLFICFYLLSDTSNKYLSPALTYMSDTLGMSQNLAGVTFLALGNGAPDVISSIVASDDNDGLEFSVGSLIGGGVFVTCIVFSSVVFFSGEVKVNRNLFLRDMILYIISILMLLVFSFFGKISLYEAIGFFTLYIVNVLFAVWQDRRANDNKDSDSLNGLDIVNEDGHTKKENSFPSLDDSNISELDFEDNLPKGEEENNQYELIARRLTRRVLKLQQVHPIEATSQEIRNNIIDESRDVEPGRENEADKKKEDLIEVAVRGNEAGEVIKEDHFYEVENSKEKHLPAKIFKQKSTISKMLENQFTSLKYRMKRNYFSSGESWGDKGIFQKIIYIFLDIPFTILRDLTIPAVELERWTRIFFIIQPLTSVIFLLLITEYIEVVAYNWYISAAVLVCLLILSVVLCKFTYRNRLPNFLFFVCIVAFIMSIFWIWAVAKVLMDILNLIEVLFKVPNAFLGLTLLSLGNSLQDFTLNCALAKTGYGEMGLAGSIAGPLFNLLMGLGAVLIKKTIRTGEVAFQLFKYEHASVLIAITIILLNLFRLLIQSMCLRYKLTKSVSWIGYSIYVIFVVCIVMFTFVFNTNPFI